MRASGYDRATGDWYVEPPWIVEALLDAEKLEGVCWDPFCGAGNIPSILQEHGILCRASDLVDRGYGATGYSFFDFRLADGADCIISNPPYNVIEQVIDHALLLAERKVALLARLALLEGQKRRRFLQGTPLARVWVSSRRVSMPPGGTDIEAKGGSIAYAWFVWERGYRGKPEIGWV